MTSNMETIKCPVCGNPGIPDYKQEDVICPHCGSDLTIYRTVAALDEDDATAGNGVKKFKTLSIVLPIVSAIMVIGITCLLHPNSNPKSDYNSMLAEKDRTISTLCDSVSVLQAQIRKLSTARAINSPTEYIIVPNDGPWSIVRKLYGNRSDWKEIAQKIAEDNGIWDAASQSWKLIHPGQILKINNEQ